MATKDTKYQYKVKNANATSSNIVVSVEFKRTDDIDKVRTENIQYPKGTTKEIIIADLESRAKREIDTYENDLEVSELLKTITNEWQIVQETIEETI